MLDDAQREYAETLLAWSASLDTERRLTYEEFEAERRVHSERPVRGRPSRAQRGSRNLVRPNIRFAA